MTDRDLLVEETLQRCLPLRPERETDWDDVLRRAEVGKRSGRRPERLVAFVVIAGALLAVASALAASGHDPFGSIASWLSGEPGEPASSSEQAGFTARNGASYAAFPSDTRLRRLTRTTVAGTTFTLLGFKNGKSLCLRLVRETLPAGRGVNRCVTLRELDASPSPALVAAEAWLTSRAGAVDGIFGFADDTVRSIQYRRGDGVWTSVPVANNVFVALDPQRANVAGPGGVVSGSIVQVRAVTSSGEKVSVPFVSGFVTYPAGLPGVPSYVSIASPKSAALPGPSRIERTIRAATIGWLLRRQPRGSAWRPPGTRLRVVGPIVYARAVQPDPASPVRIGLFLRQATPGSLGPRVPSETLVLCETEIRPLLGDSGYSCHPAGRDAAAGSLFPAGQPFTVGPVQGGQQLTELTGAAADGVASLRLYLGSGRVIPAALSDNAYSVTAPTTQFPAKLVAYDARGKVVGLQVIGGPARPVPCPTLAAWPASELPAPKPYQRLDLGNLSVNGAPILGRTPAQVEAALGQPQRKAGFRHTGYGQPTFFYGGTLPSGTLLLVQFHRGKNGMKAAALTFQGRGLLDTRLSHLLNLTPATLQNLLESTYGYRATTPYGSAPGALGFGAGVGCSGIVEAANGTEIDFGLNPHEGARPFITIVHP